MSGKWWQILLIIGAISLVTVLHLLTPLDRLLAHQIYQRLYYIPIVAAAFLFGWRGGLITAAVASLSYLPHIFLHWHHTEYNYALNQYAEIALFLLVGGTIGLLGDRNRHEHARAERINAELEQAYAELRQTVNQLLQAERLSSLGEIAASVVHELRNPLGAIKGAVEILEDELAPHSPRHEFAEIAKREIERLDNLGKEFLYFSRPPKIEKEPTDLNGLVLDVQSLVEKQAASQQVEVNLELDKNLPPAQVDGEQIKQVLLNLAINALQAMPEGGRLSFATQKTDKAFVIEVKDTGGGVDPAIQDKIFEPFFSTKESGVGLGLAMSYKIVSQHGGNLTVRNFENGAVFGVEIPLIGT